MRSFSKKEALAYGWHRFKERPFFLAGLFLITTFLSALSGFIAENVSGVGIGTLLNLLDFAVQIILGMGTTLILLRVYDQVDTDYTDLVEPIHLFWKYLAVTVLATIVILFGFVLFIIPGIIAGIALAFTSYLVIDRNLRPVAALKESLRITHGHRWNILIFALVLFLLNIGGALLLGFGLLVTIPVSALATVHVYRWLLSPREEEGVVVSVFAKMMTAFIVAVVVGGVAFLLFLFQSSLALDTPSIRDAQRRADITQIQLGAALYYDVNGAFPPSLAALVPEYLETIPVDPQTATPYPYTAFAQGADYEVCTVLETAAEAGGVYCEYGLELSASEDFGQPDSFFLEDVPAE